MAAIEPSAGAGRRELPATVAVGRLIKAHGIRGEMFAEALSDVPGRLEAGSELIAVLAGRPPFRVVIETSRPFRSGALVRLRGYADRDAVEPLRGAWLEVETERVPPAEAGSYYQFQLVGCTCHEKGREIGRVVELEENGGGLLLVLEDGARRIPVPFVAKFLKEVDVERGIIELDLPEGLLEACASAS
jgi:16S rRNA processing protein RimM